MSQLSYTKEVIMELLQDGVLFGLALVALVASVALIEWCIAHIGVQSALWGVLISFVCIFLISEVGAWISVTYLSIPHLTGYGRTFSYAAFGLILYALMRVYQLLRKNET